MKDYIQYDALGLAELVAKGKVQALELVEAAIGEVERLNSKINAVINRQFEQAREIAQGTLPQGPFTGVPFLLKDIIALQAGVPFTSGSRFMEGFIPDHDSELVRRYKQAGLIILGKTNLPEFGIQPTTEPVLWGPARNPWDTSKTTGGSSGGAAAAVAARMVPMAHGNDGGGSIRIPSSCCGVFGLKPTRARITLGPDFTEFIAGLVVEHALTRSVRDSAALLDVTAGPMPGDPYQAPVPGGPFLKEVATSPGKLKIAFTTESPLGGEIHPDCGKALEDTAGLLTDLGHQVEACPFDLQSDILVDAFLKVWKVGVARAVESISQLRGRAPNKDELEILTRAMWEFGREVKATDYLAALQIIQGMARPIARQFEKYDLWLTPTLAKPPLPLGAMDSDESDPIRGLMAGAHFSPYTSLCNVTGQPAMSVPLFWNEEGLPIGSHFIGRYGDEATLFRLAGQLEAALPWAGKLPPMVKVSGSN